MIHVGDWLRTRSNVALRSAPSDESQYHITTIPAGMEAILLDATPRNGHYRLRYEGRDGWSLSRNWQEIILPWGGKVSPEFKAKVITISHELGCNPDYLMACMAFETWMTFSPSYRNPDSGATGLIQFLPSTASWLGTSIAQLAKMSAVQQLDYVKKYLAQFKGRLNTLEDMYMAILWPAAIGRSNDTVLFKRGTTEYTQNARLDQNNDGSVTRYEAASPVRQKLSEGSGYQA